MARTLPTLALLLPLVGATLAAQPPSNWTTVTLPANRTSAPNSIGTTVTFLTTNSAWLYSGITKRWTVLPLTTPGTIFQANDYCLVQDGARLHGYASHTGAVDTITTSGSATIVSGPASSSWVTLVADGTTAWGFGAFHGRWERITLSQPNPVMVANRLIGMLRDGTTVYGLSAHHGTFVPVSADASANLAVVGEAEVGTAHSPGWFRAFSAQQNVWGVQAVPANATMMQQNEYAMAWAANRIWAFSGLCGVLDTYVATNAIPPVSNAEGVAAFQDGNDVVCYGSGRGRFVARQAPGATFYLDYHYVLVQQPSAVTPFSAITGTYGTPIPGSFTLVANDAVAWLDAGTTGYAYSAIRNDAIAAPAPSPSAADAVRDAVVLTYPYGFVARSARHGDWVTLPQQPLGTLAAPANGSSITVKDPAGSTLSVFDNRLDRWATITAAAPLTMRISRHTVMAHDGQTAFGFGQPSSEWFAQPLVAAPATFDTASSIGCVEHGNQLSVYSVQGSFSYTGRFPEFTQAINLGNTLVLHQVAAPGSGMLMLVGVRPARIELGALGRLYVDPSLLVTFGWPQTVGVEGMLDLRLPVPHDPGLVGQQLHFQNVVVPQSGAPWLSTSVAPVFF